MIPGIDDIEYRARFLVKSHMKTKLTDSPNYGVCVLNKIRKSATNKVYPVSILRRRKQDS